MFFPEGMGGVQNSSGNSEGLGGVILVVKKWKFRGGGGGLCEIPSMVGVWIFSGTIQCDGKTTITITFPYPDTM